MKLDDIQFLVRDINNEMPIHTEVNARIPYVYKAFPKNLIEESHKVCNKYFNNHLSEIEEAVHCKLLSKEFVSWFLYQSRKYHLESGILNHDGFFAMDPYGIFGFDRKMSYIMGNMNTYSYAVAGCTAGSEVVMGSAVSSIGFGPDVIYAVKNDGGQFTTDTCYDEIALNISVANGNYRLGFYDDNTDPNNLLSETVSLVTAVAFDYKSMPEATIPTTTGWIAINNDDGTAKTNSNTSDTGGRQKSHTFGTFPDPAGGSFTNSMGFTPNCKVRHT